MKKILWILYDRKVEFNVNWFEYLVLMNIFNKKKYLSSEFKLKGRCYHRVICDECGVLT